MPHLSTRLRNRLLVVLPLALACAMSGDAVAQRKRQRQLAVEHTLTPEVIADAINAGSLTSQYRLVAHGLLLGYISTPFSRVATAAALAKRRYQLFTAADVTQEMIAQELWIYAFPYNATGASGPDIRNVEAVVLTPAQSRDIKAAIHPTRTKDFSTDYQNLYGAKFEGRGLIGMFPLEFLDNRFEVHIVYDVPWSCGIRKAVDCVVRFSLQNIQ
jgi:hypothetical protein